MRLGAGTAAELDDRAVRQGDRGGHRGHARPAGDGGQGLGARGLGQIEDAGAVVADRHHARMVVARGVGQRKRAGAPRIVLAVDEEEPLAAAGQPAATSGIAAVSNAGTATPVGQ